MEGKGERMETEPICQMYGSAILRDVKCIGNRGFGSQKDV